MRQCTLSTQIACPFEDCSAIVSLSLALPSTRPLPTGPVKPTSIPRIYPLFSQRDSNGTKAGIVDREDPDGGAANRCLSRQVRTIPFKMVAPTVSPGMKEFDDCAGLRIPPGNV